MEFKWWGQESGGKKPAQPQPQRSGSMQADHSFSFAPGMPDPGTGNRQPPQPSSSGARSRSMPCSAGAGIVHTASPSPLPHQPPLSGSKPPWATEEDFEAAAAAQAAAAAAEARRAAARARAAAAARSPAVEGRRPWQDLEPPRAHLDDGRWGDSGGGADREAEDLPAGTSFVGEKPSGRLESEATPPPVPAQSPPSGRFMEADNLMPAVGVTGFPQQRISPSYGPGAGSASRRPPSAPRDRGRASADTTLASVSSVPRGGSGSRLATIQLRAGRITATVMDSNYNLPSGDLGAAEKLSGARVPAAASRRPGAGASGGLLSQQQGGCSGSGGHGGGAAMTAAAGQPRGSSSCGRVRPPSPSAGRDGGSTPASSMRRTGLEADSRYDESPLALDLQRNLRLSPAATESPVGLGPGSASRWMDQADEDAYDPTAAAAHGHSSRRPTSGDRPRSSHAAPMLGLGDSPGSEAFGGFHGRGLTVESTSRRAAPGGLDPQAAATLRDENRALKREVQQLREVLQAVQHPAGAGGGGGSKGARGQGGFPYERQQQPKAGAVSGGSAAMQAELSSTRRYKAQVVQLHRQVALLSEELQVRGQVVSEAEAALLDISLRLETLLKLPTAPGGTAIVGRKPAAAATSSSRATQQQQQQQGSVSGGGGCSDGAAATDPDAKDGSLLLLAADGYRELQRFARQMLSRVRSSDLLPTRSERSQAARQLTRPGQSLRQQQPQGDSGCAGLGWEVPFIPAGGNRFLFASTADRQHPPDEAGTSSSHCLPLSLHHPPNMTDIVAGCSGAAVGHPLLQLLCAATAASSPGEEAVQFAQGTSRTALASDAAAAACSELHGLELRLAELGPRLGSLAVLLRASILPAMPWLSAEGADRIQAEVAETAEALSGAARPLSELASLLPAGPLVSSSAAASEARRRAASSAAARDGWLWSQQGGSGSSGDDGAMAGGGGVAAAAEREEAKEEDWGADGGGDGMLGIDLESLSSAAVALWSSLVPAAGGGGGGGGGAAGRRPATMLQALNEALRRIFAPRASAAASRMSLLQRELSFCCRASALQSQHVSRLSLAVVEAVKGAYGGGSDSTATTAASSRQRQGQGQGQGQGQEPVGGSAASQLLPGAACALRDVLAAHDRLVRQPSEAALRDVVSELAAARSTLDFAPDAMETASVVAENLQARLLQRLASLSGPFRQALEALDRKRQRSRQQRPPSSACAVATGEGALIVTPWDSDEPGGGGGGGGGSGGAVYSGHDRGPPLLDTAAAPQRGGGHRVVVAGSSKMDWQG